MNFDRYFYNGKDLDWFIYNQSDNPDIQFLFNETTQMFEIRPKIANRFPTNVYATGNLKNMLGVQKALWRVNGVYDVTKNIFSSIKYLKLVSNDVQASITPGNGVICVLMPSQFKEGFQENISFGTHMRIISNMQIKLSLVDQDDRPVQCTYLNIDGQLFKKEYFD